jgi:hypothetical protein
MVVRSIFFNRQPWQYEGYDGASRERETDLWEYNNKVGVGDI